MKVINDNLSSRYIFFCDGCKEDHAVGRINHSFNGDLQKPTFKPSIVIKGKYFCHSFITNGSIEYLNDCTHSLSGKTVKLQNNKKWKSK